MTRAALYLRVSTEEQRERQSIQNQRDFADAYCRLHEITVYDRYEDDGVSGAIAVDQRPEGRRLLEDAAKKRFDVVLVYRIDRMARSTLELLRCVDTLEASGVALRSMSEPFDTASSVGRFVLTMLASIAQLEKDTIRERLMLGAARAAREGRWNGGPTPFGYRLGEDGRLEIDESQADIVRLIFQLYVDDRLGTVAVADYLNARGVPLRATTKGNGRPIVNGKWQAGAISRILNDTTYAGVSVYRKTRNVRRGATVTTEAAPVDQHIERAVPPIVSPEIQAEAKRLLRANLMQASRNAKKVYLLRGLITCGRCGNTFVGDGDHQKQRFYYRCTGNSSFRGKSLPKCGAKSIRSEALEEIVWQDICAVLANPGDVLARLAEQVREQSAVQAPVESEIADVEQAIRDKQAERQRVIGLVRRGTVSEAEGDAELLQVGRELLALERRRDSLLDRELHAQAMQTRLVGADALLRQYQREIDQADDTTKRAVIEALVEGIVIDTVGEGRQKRSEVTIRYCFEQPASDNSVDASAHEEQSDLWIESRLAILTTTQYGERIGITPKYVRQRITDGRVRAIRLYDYYVTEAL